LKKGKVMRGSIMMMLRPGNIVKKIRKRAMDQTLTAAAFNGGNLPLLNVLERDAFALQMEQHGDAGDELLQQNAFSRTARKKLNREIYTIFLIEAGPMIFTLMLFIICFSIYHCPNRMSRHYHCYYRDTGNRN
jgi:hypothetical protein